MKAWSVDKLVGVGLVVSLLVAVLGGLIANSDEAWTMGKEIAIGLLGFMKGIEHSHKEEQKNG